MKRMWGILMFSLAITLMQVGQATVNAGDGVEIVGISTKDFTVVNGTVQISFQISSGTLVENVVLSYIDYEGKVVNTTLIPTEKNGEQWWGATIKPKVFEEKEGDEATTSIRIEKLFVFLTDKTVVEKPIGTLTLIKKMVQTVTFIVVPWLLLGIVWGAGFVSGGVIVLVKRIRRKEKLERELVTKILKTEKPFIYVRR
jgi:hypothetical protein